MHRFARYEVPANVLTSLGEWYDAYGKLVLRQDLSGHLHLEVSEPSIMERLCHDEALRPFWTEERAGAFLVLVGERGNLKQALVRAGYPVKDLCGYVAGTVLKDW